jgi:hypothetical protein
MTLKRNRRKQTTAFDERLQKAACEAREVARQLPPGPQRDLLLRKAGQAETACHINEWLTSPGLRTPRCGREPDRVLPNTGAALVKHRAGLI